MDVYVTVEQEFAFDIDVTASGDIDLFMGWSTEPNGEVEYFEGDGPGWSGGVTLYARWKPDQ